MRPIPEATKQEALRLRKEQKLSLKAIASRLGVSKGTLSVLLREHPLPTEEVRQRKVLNGQHSRGRRWATPLQETAPLWLQKAYGESSYTRQEMGLIAETAVLFRLRVHRLVVYHVDPGSREDWLVFVPTTGKYLKVQVKTATAAPSRSTQPPSISLRCRDLPGYKARRKYKEGEFDVIVGYDIKTDSCYVWTWAEVEHLATTVTTHPDALERWDKLFVGD